MQAVTENYSAKLASVRGGIQKGPRKNPIQLFFNESTHYTLDKDKGWFGAQTKKNRDTRKKG